MGKARKHHIVPQCLLRKFTNSDGRLARLKFKVDYEKAGKLFYPTQICYKEDFYRIQNKSLGLDSFLIEELVNPIYENDLNRCWKVFEDDTPSVSLVWKQRVREIIIHLMSRSEFIRASVFTGDGRERLIDSFKKNWMEDLRNELINPMARDLYKGFLQSPESLDSFAREVYPEEHAGLLHSTFLLDQEFSSDTAPKGKVLDMFINGLWTIHTAVSDHEFILSDKVGMFFSASNSKLPLTGPFNFYFPVSSSKYLQIYYDGHNQPYGIQRRLYFATAQPQHVRSMNISVVANAFAEIYASRGELLEEARRDFVSDPRT